MGLMDKVKAQATQLADKAQQAGQAGQAKLQDLQAKRKGDALLLELGGEVYNQKVGRADGSADTRIAGLVARLQAYEAEHGTLTVTSADATPDSAVPGGEPGATAILSPSALGFDGSRLTSMFKGNTAEIGQFKQEPPRDSLTQPPAGYQTPSPNFAYGTGPKESLNKVYAPDQGKYGDQ